MDEQLEPADSAAGNRRKDPQPRRNRKNACPSCSRSSNESARRTRPSSKPCTRAFETAQKNKRDRDHDLEEGAQKVEKLKARTSEIKNEQGVQALLKEIETVEQENKAIEDDILTLMEKIDAAAARDQPQRSRRRRRRKSAIEAERKQHEADIAKLEAELQGVEQAREELAARVDPSVLSTYQKLLRTKGGRGHCRGARRVLLRLLHEHTAPDFRERQEERRASSPAPIATGSCIIRKRSRRNKNRDAGMPQVRSQDRVRGIRAARLNRLIRSESLLWN